MFFEKMFIEYRAVGYYNYLKANHINTSIIVNIAYLIFIYLLIFTRLYFTGEMIN